MQAGQSVLNGVINSLAGTGASQAGEKLANSVSNSGKTDTSKNSFDPNGDGKFTTNEFRDMVHDNKIPGVDIYDPKYYDKSGHFLKDSLEKDIFKNPDFRKLYPHPRQADAVSKALGLNIQKFLK